MTLTRHRTMRTGRNRRNTNTRSQKDGDELIPRGQAQVELKLEGHAVRLTNLQKMFWPELGLTKGDLLRYYAQVSPFLLPHLVDRAMVMKRYPNGAAGEF